MNFSLRLSALRLRARAQRFPPLFLRSNPRPLFSLMPPQARGRLRPNRVFPPAPLPSRAWLRNRSGDLPARLPARNTPLRRTPFLRRRIPDSGRKCRSVRSQSGRGRKSGLSPALVRRLRRRQDKSLLLFILKKIPGTRTLLSTSLQKTRKRTRYRVANLLL